LKKTRLSSISLVFTPSFTHLPVLISNKSFLPPTLSTEAEAVGMMGEEELGQLADYRQLYFLSGLVGVDGCEGRTERVMVKNGEVEGRYVQVGLDDDNDDENISSSTVAVIVLASLFGLAAVGCVLFMLYVVAQRRMKGKEEEKEESKEEMGVGLGKIFIEE
jgi:hypothetical protein